MRPRWLLWAALLAPAACGLGGVGAQPDPDLDGGPDGPPEEGEHGDPVVAHARADVATQALLLRFWRGDLAYLGATSPDPANARAGYWTFAQALDAVLDAVERHQGRGPMRGWIETLYLAQEARGWDSPYFDDQCWMALALLRAYQLTGDARYLDRATALALDVVGAWDETCCGNRPGGVWWDAAHTQKATAANAGAALLAARLATETGDGVWLESARRIYAFWRAEMVDPDTHQVYDHIEPDGSVVKWVFTYNEGLMIGAAVALHEATGEAAFLEDAHAIASFLVSEEVTQSPFGDVLSDGRKCSGDCRQFKGIAYRYLASLEQIAPTNWRYRAVLDASAYSLWEIARHPASNTFGVEWSEPQRETAVSISQQSSAAMALNVHAALRGAAPDEAAPRFTYQAEDAVLAGVGVEASHGSFEGWGYVAGWHADGQRVDFRVDVPDEGDYTLRLRYAADAGDALRVLSVNGARIEDGLRFAATAGWDQYAEATAVAHLSAGASTVSVSYDAARASDGFLNVDRLSLDPID